MGIETVMVDNKSECFYIWGKYNPETVSVSQELWRFCDNGGGDRGAWEKVNPDPDTEFDDYPSLVHPAYASTDTAGFAFGGRIYKSSLSDWQGSSDQYRSFNFTTKAWTSGDLPAVRSLTEQRTLWGAKAIFVPNYGLNGLIFLLGGVTGGKLQVSDGDAYPSFTTVHFLDPVTKVWHHQETTATSNGFPVGRHGHCVAGVAGANNTYEM